MSGEHANVKKNILDHFINGALNGWKIGINSMLPNVLMAYVLIQILKISGLLTLIGQVASPVMALWGLPGEGLVVLMSALMSMGGAMGVAVSLYATNSLSVTDITVLTPAVYLMGSLIQYLGRCLGTAGANPRYWGIQIVLCIFNAMCGMWLMRFFMSFM